MNVKITVFIDEFIYGNFPSIQQLKFFCTVYEFFLSQFYCLLLLKIQLFFFYDVRAIGGVMALITAIVNICSLYWDSETLETETLA